MTSKEFKPRVSGADAGPSIVESLAMPDATAAEFEPPRLADKLLTAPELC